MRIRRGPQVLSPFQRISIHTCLLILCIPAMLPFIWMLSTSFKLDSDIYGASKAGGAAISLASLIPHPFHPQNYPEALKTVPFAGYLFNSLGLCATTILGAVASSAIVAYGFARIQFKGRDFWFMVMISTMALPGQVTMIPQFAVFRWLGWYGGYLPLTVPSFAGAPFFIFLLTQFFRTVPAEMAESARLDGAGEWTIFCRIVLPLSKPALATCALFQFLGTWNDFMGPLLYINDPRNTPSPTASSSSTPATTANGPNSWPPRLCSPFRSSSSFSSPRRHSFKGWRRREGGISGERCCGIGVLRYCGPDLGKP